MSQGFPCNCAAPDNRTKWRVVDYKCNYSAFNGNRYTPSDYSAVRCMGCGRSWRTKAKYVVSLPHATNEEKLRP